MSWSTLEQFLGRGLSFGIQILLARLIAPDEFGLLALILIFITFATLITSSGLGQALIQAREISRTDVSTVFFSNVILGFLLYAILFTVAPTIANFYEESRLVSLIRWATIVVVIGSFGQVQQSLFQRELQFKKLFWITTPAFLTSGAVGIIMGLAGYEVWALVALRITYSVVATSGFWMFSNREWWPRREFSFKSLVRLGRFGSGVMSTSIVNQFVMNSYGLVIGKAFSFGHLAFYNRARQFQKVPSQSLAQIIIRVMFPVLSRISDDDPRMIGALRRGIPVLVFALFPAMGLLMVTADHVIVILLTDKWLPAAPYLRWFPIIGMMMPLAALYWSVIRAKGRAWLIFWLSAVKNSLALVALFLTIPYGVLAIVIGQVVVSLINNLLLNWPTLHWLIGYKMKWQLADVWPYALGTAIAGVVGYYCGQWSNLNSHFLLFVLQSAVMLSVYLLYCLAFRLPGFSLSLAFVQSTWKKAIQTYQAWRKTPTTAERL